jgi:(R,R)-butanediol dehydrogenase/meso-butanediol dehydrogenase/diacetyl reductase
MKTEAIIVGADHVARLQPMDLPELTESRVLVETLISGVSCGTEADCTSGRAAYMPTPFLTGYQAVGKVVKAGGGVGGLAAGDLVFTNGGGLWGMTHLAGGSHARQSVAEAAEVVKLSPQTPSLKTASYAALAAIALDGISRMKVEKGRALGIFGLGMLGQLAGKLGQLEGMRAIGVNRSPWKRDEARAFGFDAVCAPEEEAIKSAVLELGAGPLKLAVDTTGNQEIFDLALATLGPWSEISLSGYYPDKFVVNLDICHGKQMSIHNPVGLGSQLPKVIKHIEDGRLNVEPLIRHTVAPSQITEFYADLVKNHSRYLGAVIDWSA